MRTPPPLLGTPAPRPPTWRVVVGMVALAFLAGFGVRLGWELAGRLLP